jgi:hypothetical protein
VASAGFGPAAGTALAISALAPSERPVPSVLWPARMNHVNGTWLTPRKRNLFNRTTGSVRPDLGPLLPSVARAAMVWALGYSRETGTTGRTGIHSFAKRHMLFGPAHFCLMAKRSIATRMASPISTRSVTAGMIELFSYMHSISSSLTAATCAASQSKRAKPNW